MDLFREFQQSTADDLESRMSTYEDAWLAAILMSIRSMRNAARWLLGVVVAWLFLVPQLTGLRELVWCRATALPRSLRWLRYC
jgi:hypothetical protein